MDRRALIQSVTSLASPWLTPELSLHLVTKDSPWWTKTPEELQRDDIPEPFWAFAWAGGQSLARFVLDHPKVVTDKDVVDFGAGGGIVTLAALKAGARSVSATEIDPWALDAFALNLSASGYAKAQVPLVIEDWIGRVLPEGTVLLCGDMSYSQELCEKLLAWFQSLRGVRIILGDAGRGFVPKEFFHELASYQTPADYDSDGRYFTRSSVLEFITCPR